MIMKKIYSVKMTNTGGRTGEVFSEDHSLDLKIAAPGSGNASDKSGTIICGRLQRLL